MKILIKNLIPLSVEINNKDNKKGVGKIIKFIRTNTGIDAIAEITNKKLINKLKNENSNT